MKPLKAVLMGTVPALLLAAGGNVSPQEAASQPSSQPATQPIAGVTTHPAITTQPVFPDNGIRAIVGARL
jgi:hypothetical protein